MFVVFQVSDRRLVNADCIELFTPALSELLIIYISVAINQADQFFLMFRIFSDRINNIILGLVLNHRIDKSCLFFYRIYEIFIYILNFSVHFHYENVRLEQNSSIGI